MNKKTIISLLISLAFIVAMMPMIASAAEDCMRDPIFDQDWNAEVTTGAFLRSIPCMEGSEVYVTLPVGEIIHVIGETDGWYKIQRADGQVGWVGTWLIEQTSKPFTGDAQTDNQPLYDIIGHPNETAIRELYYDGIISGHPDGSFKPDDPLNRAELVKLLVEATVEDFDAIKSSYQKQCFPDISATEWYTAYVCYAQENNIVEGYPDGTFKPATKINKVEAVKVVLEAFEWYVGDPPSTFSFDDTSTKTWYAPYLEIAHNKGILEQTSMLFHPNESITRGGVSHIIYEVMTTEAVEMPI